ncbi:Trehalose synthase [uncultured archaeon]|nr:Trehalose synthase [uncultured archaeon]
MDVLLFYPILFQKGGADRVLLEIARAFNAPIYTGIYRKESTFSEFSELDVREVRQPVLDKSLFFLQNNVAAKGFALTSAKFLAHKVREDYDVINAHGTPSNWVRNRNERVCWYFYSPVRSAFDLYEYRVAGLPLKKRVVRDAMFSAYKFMESVIDPKIEKTVSVSPYVNVRDASFISKYIRKPVEPVPPGVDEKLFVNESYGKYFLYPSRMIPEKRLEYAIGAFREFCKKKKGWKLILTGFQPQRERELKYMETLKSLASGLDVEFRMDIPEKELRNLYANAYAVLFCAMNEDWGLVPLEAMASEKPCISVNEGGPSYSIVDGKTGFLVNSPAQMAEKMLLLAENPGENEKMGRQGRKRVLENYTWAAFLKKMENAFMEVAKSKIQ